jgi:hypothetical protein
VRVAVKPVLVCDICGDDGGSVRSYRTVFPGGMVWEVDLCPKPRCGGQLEAFREKGWGREVKGRGRRRTFEVSSLEEIQKKAEAGRKKRP